MSGVFNYGLWDNRTSASIWFLVSLDMKFLTVVKRKVKFERVLVLELLVADSFQLRIDMSTLGTIGKICVFVSFTISN